MKLPATTGKKVVKALEKSGFSIVRQKGSHIRLVKITDEETIKLTVPLRKSLKKGTLKRIIKDSKLKLEDILEYLLMI